MLGLGNFVQIMDGCCQGKIYLKGFQRQLTASSDYFCKGSGNINFCVCCKGFKSFKDGLKPCFLSLN